MNLTRASSNKEAVGREKTAAATRRGAIQQTRRIPNSEFRLEPRCAALPPLPSPLSSSPCHSRTRVSRPSYLNGQRRECVPSSPCSCPQFHSEYGYVFDSWWKYSQEIGHPPLILPFPLSRSLIYSLCTTLQNIITGPSGANRETGKLIKMRRRGWVLCEQAQKLLVQRTACLRTPNMLKWGKEITSFR